MYVGMTAVRSKRILKYAELKSFANRFSLYFYIFLPPIWMNSYSPWIDQSIGNEDFAFLCYKTGNLDGRLA